MEPYLLWNSRKWSNWRISEAGLSSLPFHQHALLKIWRPRNIPFGWSPTSSVLAATVIPLSWFLIVFCHRIWGVLCGLRIHAAFTKDHFYSISAMASPYGTTCETREASTYLPCDCFIDELEGEVFWRTLEHKVQPLFLYNVVAEEVAVKPYIDLTVTHITPRH